MGLTEREKFEAWAPSAYLDIDVHDQGDEYIEHSTQKAWLAWQAATAAAQSETLLDHAQVHMAEHDHDGYAINCVREDFHLVYGKRRKVAELTRALHQVTEVDVINWCERHGARVVKQNLTTERVSGPYTLQEFEALVCRTIGYRYVPRDFATYGQGGELQFVNEDLNRMREVVNAAVLAAAPKVAQPEKPGDGWIENAAYLLTNCPHTVRMREGGGAEDLLSSLVATFKKMEHMLQADAPKVRGSQSRWPQAVARGWIDCPICGEPDTRCETFEEGLTLIECINHACDSNVPKPATIKECLTVGEPPCDHWFIDWGDETSQLHDGEPLPSDLSGAHIDGGKVVRLWLAPPVAHPDARDASDTARLNFMADRLFGRAAKPRQDGLYRYFPKARYDFTLWGSSLRAAIDAAMGETSS